MFVRGFSVVFVPLAALLTPLFFHRSETPAVGPYAWSYLVPVGMVSLGALALSVAIGRACRRRDDLQPAFAAVVTTLACVGLLASIEVVLGSHDVDPFGGYRFWGHRRSVLFGFEADANRTWKAAGATYDTDAHGFRVHLRDPDWTDGPGPRIFALGASSTFGYGLDDDATWPHRLEELVRERLGDEHAVVINAGNNGHRSLQTMLRLYVRVLPYRPDYVLYYEAVNDVARGPLPPEGLPPLAEMAVFTESLRTLHRKAHPGYNLYARTVTGMYVQGFFQRFEPGWLEALDGPGEVSGAPPAAAPDLDAVLRENGAVFVRNVETTVDMARRAGTVPVLLTFLCDPQTIGDYPGRSIRYYNQLLRELSEREHVPLVDLEGEFEGLPNKKSYFFWDGYHPNPQGVAFIAEKTAPPLAALLEERRAGRAQAAASAR